MSVSCCRSLSRQHRAIRQEVSGRIFAPIQSLENEGILYQHVKKASQSLPPAGGKGILIIFCRGVYLTENTTQATSVRLVRCKRTRCARSRLQSFCQKRAKPFFDSLLYVFLVFQAEEVGQKDGGDSQAQLCGVALKTSVFFLPGFLPELTYNREICTNMLSSRECHCPEMTTKP